MKIQTILLGLLVFLTSCTVDISRSAIDYSGEWTGSKICDNSGIGESSIELVITQNGILQYEVLVDNVTMYRASQDNDILPIDLETATRVADGTQTLLDGTLEVISPQTLLFTYIQVEGENQVVCESILKRK